MAREIADLALVNLVVRIARDTGGRPEKREGAPARAHDGQWRSWHGPVVWHGTGRRRRRRVLDRQQRAIGGGRALSRFEPVRSVRDALITDQDPAEVGSRGVEPPLD